MISIIKYKRREKHLQRDKGCDELWTSRHSEGWLVVRGRRGRRRHQANVRWYEKAQVKIDQPI